MEEKVRKAHDLAKELASSAVPCECWSLVYRAVFEAMLDWANANPPPESPMAIAPTTLIMTGVQDAIDSLGHWARKRNWVEARKSLVEISILIDEQSKEAA